MNPIFNENALEHVEHTYRYTLQEYGLPFWCIPDIDNSWMYLNYLDEDGSQTSIDKTERSKNIERAERAFCQKHGLYI